jgi:hypothetical protein
MRLRAPTLAFLAFMLIFPIDLVAYTTRVTTGVAIPVGMLGFTICALLMAMCLLGHGRRFLPRLAAMCLVLSPIAVACLSPQFAWFDIYFWMRAAGLFSLGYFFMTWVAQHPRGNVCVVAALLICGVLTISIPHSVIAGGEGNYLRIGDAMMVTAFVALATCRSLGWYWAATGFSLVCLYAVGSRASLGLAAIASVTVGAMRFRFATLVGLAVAAIPVAAIAAIYAYSRFRSLASVHDDRLLRLLFAPSLDTSLAARRSLNAEAWSVFLENPLLGDYRFYERDGREGAYAHNLLSLWSELGVVGIAISVVVLGVGVGALWRARRRLDEAAARFAFLTALALILGMLFAKSHVWTVMYFAFGGLFAFLIGDVRVRGPGAFPMRLGRSGGGVAALPDLRLEGRLTRYESPVGPRLGPGDSR